MNSRTTNQPSIRRRPGLRAGLAWTLLLWAAFAPVGRGQEAVAPAAAHPFRIGIASSLFVDINEADAKVFLKVWTETIAKKVNIETDPRPVILDGVVALEQALQSGQVDSATLTTLEYLAMSASMQKGPVLLPVVNGRSTEEYLLLVHRDHRTSSMTLVKRKLNAVMRATMMKMIVEMAVARP